MTDTIQTSVERTGAHLVFEDTLTPEVEWAERTVEKSREVRRGSLFVYYKHVVVVLYRVYLFTTCSVFR